MVCVRVRVRVQYSVRQRLVADCYPVANADGQVEAEAEVDVMYKADDFAATWDSEV